MRRDGFFCRSGVLDVGKTTYKLLLKTSRVWGLLPILQLDDVFSSSQIQIGPASLGLDDRRSALERIGIDDPNMASPR